MATEITERLEGLGKQVLKLRDKDGLAWHEIAANVGESMGKTMLAYEFAKVKPSEVVTARNDTEMGKKIVALRDKENLSWGVISARTRTPESTCRGLYTAATGTDTKGLRIGKGGRFPGSSNGARPAKKAPVKKQVAKKAPVKKQVAKKAPVGKKAPGKKAPAKKQSGRSASPGGRTTTAAGKGQLVDADYDTLVERLEGKTIQVEREGRKAEVFKVRSVTRLDGGNVSFIDGRSGNERTVPVASIKRAASAK